MAVYTNHVITLLKAGRDRLSPRRTQTRSGFGSPAPRHVPAAAPVPDLARAAAGRDRDDQGQPERRPAPGDQPDQGRDEQAAVEIRGVELLSSTHRRCPPGGKT